MHMPSIIIALVLGVVALGMVKAKSKAVVTVGVLVGTAGMLFVAAGFTG